MRQAAGPAVAIYRGVAPDQLTAATPCPEYDVRALISHLLQWGPMLVGAGRRETVGPVPDRAGDGWLAVLEAQTADLVDAWSSPKAWQGTAPMGGPIAAPIVGGLALGELVLHGWDLARATDQIASWPDDVLACAYDAAAATAEQGRSTGAYGPPVAVPPGASTMDRLLGLTGRVPQWTSGRRRGAGPERRHLRVPRDPRGAIPAGR
jgi:uncharacterized protein (TIGR03086 family)